MNSQLRKFIGADKVDKLTTVSLQDVIGMIRNAEKNIHILNQARIHAIEDLEKILTEKEALQSEINNLEVRLAETDAKIRVAAQDKIHVELLQDHLEKLQTEMSNRNGTQDIVLRSPDRQTRALSEELSALRNENMFLKDDIMTLKEQLSEKERNVLESSLKELEYKLTLYQDDGAQLSTLRSECETLWDKVEHLQELLDKSTSQADQAILFIGADKVDKLTTVSLQDVIGMIRNAEKNIHILNQARIHAIEDLEKILTEKEALQSEINNLEVRLAETDAKIRVAAQDKIHVELLQDHLEKLQTEMSNRNGTQDIVLRSPDRQTRALSEELSALRNENMFLKDDIMTLKEQLSEKERNVLESSLKELEYKLTLYQDDGEQLSTLRSECETLWDKVEHLQELLDKSTSQADQAILVLQQNQELRKKVERLEESLEDASIYKLSSEKLQQYNELMQQKIKLLDERLERSDAEIHSYVQLYQDSVKEFQDTLDNLKEESKKKAAGKQVDMPWEFWSRLLLMVSAWFLEKKIHEDEAKTLREMTWKKDARIHDVYMECKDKSEPEILAAFRKLTSSSSSPGLHVIHIAAEMAPVAKVGGLGDVFIKDLRVLDLVVESYFDGQLFKNKIWIGTVEGLPVYFIEPLHPAKFFWRGKTYGEPDDLKRFSFFSRAALELLHQAGKKPDIIHCTAPAAEIASCGLDIHHLNRPDRMQDHSSTDRINPGAIVFSNIVTTVSPTYAQEVRTPQGGQGLHATLNAHAQKFVGILNGIDTDAWNPATDGYLRFQYNANDLEGKYENKKALRRHLGLSVADSSRPLVGCITRLVPQKGVHLIRHAIYRALELGGQFVLLGSSPAFNGAFDRAFKHYLGDSEGWEELMHKVMSIDFSWDTSASQYEELYQQSVAKARAARRAAG
nr:probable starch synthase 4, chloroplastic/amyloplastic [Tanacetum cinerariifolium]